MSCFSFFPTLSIFLNSSQSQLIFLTSTLVIFYTRTFFTFYEQFSYRDGDHPFEKDRADILQNLLLL